MAVEALPIKDGWFAEKEAMWPGQRFCLQVKEVLHQEKSQYQDIMVFDSMTYGRVLILDGVIQLTERDEFAYQEMIAHLPIFGHRKPENVLIVGGGDGGVLREVARHKGIKKIVMCEIDERVVEVSKKFFGSTMATAYNDPRLELHFMDAALYMKEHQNFFDVIIVDSSDPVGPAETLYTSDFYRDMWQALRGDGVVCTQGECTWLHLQLIERVMRDAKGLYPTVDYAYSCVPTYPNGQIGFVLASRNPDALSLREPKRPVPADMASVLRYYTASMHRASFKLPQFAEAGLSKVRPPSTAGEVTRDDIVRASAVAVAAAAVVGVGAFILARALRR
jgi:spermidine synthase